jgi:hypothetical protein
MYEQNWVKHLRPWVGIIIDVSFLDDKKDFNKIQLIRFN